MYEVEVATGIVPDNPCFKIKSYHLHESGYRNPGDRVNNIKSRTAYPHENLEGVAQKSWAWINPK
jgi:hypothetical protein